MVDDRLRGGSPSFFGDGWARGLATLLALAVALALAWASEPALAQETPKDGASAEKEAASLDCSDFATQRGAQAVFDRSPVASKGDPFELDKDADGKACEAALGGAAEDGTELGARNPGDLDCVDLPSQAAAQARLRTDPSDPDGLDPENNGVACEFAPVPYEDVAFDGAPVAAARSKADVDCEDFEFQQEAQMVYLRDQSDPNGLDGPGEKAENDERFVGNDFACETLPLLASNVEEMRAAGGRESGRTGDPSGARRRVAPRRRAWLAAGPRRAATGRLRRLGPAGRAAIASLLRLVRAISPPVTIRESPLPRCGSSAPYDGESKARRACGGARGFAKPSSVAALPCLLLCLALFLSGCGALGGSGASCGQSPPSVEPARAAPGETFRLYGGGFREGCNDTGFAGLPFLKEPARQDIRVEMRQGGKSWALASGLAASDPPDYALDVDLEVPADAKPGRAMIAIPDPNNAEPLKVPFGVLGSGSG